MLRILLLLLLSTAFFCCSTPETDREKFTWKGKKIVWTGTTTPWQYDTKSYPNQIGKLLETEMFNTSVANSRIAFRAKDTEGVGLEGLSGTYAELIASGYAQNFSYENKIIPYLKDPYNADVVVIDHGQNDAELLESRPGTIDSRDKSTFYGAFNSVIDAIQKQNPKCKIILCTPPNGYVYGGVEPFVSRFRILRSAILAIGYSRKLPVWDMMSRSGITAGNVSVWTNNDLYPNQTMTDSLAKDGYTFFSSIDFNL
ncbi:SGNH/GDSL hydrolase family protein [Dyadobacter diqingensis]|uniref:SGNH/GDSL hydrolase family protein n=1 Tax=Dyadobacter diqingensis TaxID=2938121 RepID=UPI0020C1B6E8|nr:hypothetical protein [Dyadobacter diqingensis]